ncbi:SCO family protein [Flexithrix dorotheae]|uniref:SCO family protein n=1 Tax=Flexithrix dorotheae TaxID=70993 RepID=UPI000374771B|nr:SCO family protein [Flexithrix dorotheae]
MRKLVIVFFILTFSCSAPHKEDPKLPILGRRETTEKKVNGKMVIDTTYHTVGDFKFLDQDSNWVSQETFKDKIYVADFFFTSCPTICPKMKAQMLRVYDQFLDNDEVLILSHSIDPETDSVGRLREYAERLGIKSEKWHMVTGEKQDIYKMGQESYIVTAKEDENAEGGFLHSGAFLLVDKNRQIRGVYDGTDEMKVDKLIQDIPRLLGEYQKGQ